MLLSNLERVENNKVGEVNRANTKKEKLPSISLNIVIIARSLIFFYARVLTQFSNFFAMRVVSKNSALVAMRFKRLS